MAGRRYLGRRTSAPLPAAAVAVVKRRSVPQASSLPTVGRRCGTLQIVASCSGLLLWPLWWGFASLQRVLGLYPALSLLARLAVLQVARRESSSDGGSGGGPSGTAGSATHAPTSGSTAAPPRPPAAGELALMAVQPSLQVGLPCFGWVLPQPASQPASQLLHRMLPGSARAGLLLVHLQDGRACTASATQCEATLNATPA